MPRERVEFPMTGKIVSVNVTVGSEIREDDTLCVLESMKMENPIVAPVSGTIIELNVTAGQTVDAGKTIAVIEY